MANTELVKVLRLVREAKHAVTSARFAPGIARKERVELEKLYVTLDTLEDDLIMEDLETRISALESASEQLGMVVDRIRKSITKLEGIAELIEKVAKAVKVLADIANKASGIL